MSNYIENNLGKDETVIIKAKKNWLYLLAPALWLILVLVLAIVANIYVSPYTTHEGLYIESSTAADMSDFDARYQNEVIREFAIQTYNANNPTNPVSNWNELRKVMKEQFRQQHRAEWEQDGEALWAQALAEAERSGMPNFLLNSGVYVLIIIWVLFVLIGVVPFVQRLLKWLSIDLALTNKRVIGKIGILRVNSLDFHLDKIDHVQIRATIFGNLFHYYSLKIVSVGGAGFDNNRRHKKDVDQFVGISNAQEFKDMATRAIELHAEEARKAQAAEIARAMGK